MNERGNEIEELDLLVDKLKLDNWNAEHGKSEIGLREAGADMKTTSDE